MRFRLITGQIYLTQIGMRGSVFDVFGFDFVRQMRSNPVYGRILDDMAHVVESGKALS